jgi:hypothetical protein
VCVGYRDESTLIFRHENDKLERKLATSRRRSSDSTSLSSNSLPSNSLPSNSPLPGSSPASSAHDDLNELARSLASHSLAGPEEIRAEEQAVSGFFDKFVMYPCSQGSSPGFLEHLPCMFTESNVENRVALRWAVRAAAYANAAAGGHDQLAREKAIKCYGLALSTLHTSLTQSKMAADDHVLMTVVVLDLFEVSSSAADCALY